MIGGWIGVLIYLRYQFFYVMLLQSRLVKDDINIIFLRSNVNIIREGVMMLVWCLG